MLKHLRVVTLGLITITALTTAAFGQQKAEFLNFSVNAYERVQSRYSPTSLTLLFTGARLNLKSPQYDLAAPRIQVITKQQTLTQNGKTVRRSKITEANATGGATLIVRHPANAQTSTVTCDKAVFKATLAAEDRGRIDLTGNVRSITRDRATGETFTSTAKSGYIEFARDAPDTVDIVLADGDFEATLKDRNTKPNPKK